MPAEQPPPEPLPVVSLYVVEIIERGEVVRRETYADCPRCGTPRADISEGFLTCENDGCGQSFLVVDTRFPSER